MSKVKNINQRLKIKDNNPHHDQPKVGVGLPAGRQGLAIVIKRVMKKQW